MAILFEGLGTEALVDETFFVLREKINAAIAYQSALHVENDKSRAERLGVPYVPVIVEPVPASNFHAGSIPSFVQDEDRAENYPMIVVMPGNVTPGSEDAAMDQIDVYGNSVVIHVFARAKMITEEGFDLVYRRSRRMAEAVHQIIKTDREIASKFRGISGPQIVEPSEPWIFPAGDGHGDDWCWMAIRLQYQIDNYSQTPLEV